MKSDSNRVLIMDLHGMMLALVIGLIFAVINSLITLSMLSIWSDLIFQNACNISLLYNYSFGKLPYVHLFIIGLPLFLLAGTITAMVTLKNIKNMNDALIMGSTTGIISSIVPYGSTWALLLLFADYWVDLLPYLQYFILVLLGVAVFVPLASLGSYYYFKDQLTERSKEYVGNPPREIASITKMTRLLKIPLLLVAVTIITIIVPLAIAYACVQMGLITVSPIP